MLNVVKYFLIGVILYSSVIIAEGFLFVQGILRNRSFRSQKRTFTGIATKDTAVDLSSEYHSCFNAMKMRRRFCPIIDSKTCCVMKRGQELDCHKASSQRFVCEPVRRKLAEILGRFMNRNGLANNDVSCCINSVDCCGNEKCSVDIHCESIKKLLPDFDEYDEKFIEDHDAADI